jgi:hypothetical protein
VARYEKLVTREEEELTLRKVEQAEEEMMYTKVSYLADREFLEQRTRPSNW